MSLRTVSSILRLHLLISILEYCAGVVVNLALWTISHSCPSFEFRMPTFSDRHVPRHPAVPNAARCLVLLAPPPPLPLLPPRPLQLRSCVHLRFGRTSEVDNDLFRTWALYWAATRPECSTYCAHDQVSEGSNYCLGRSKHLNCRRHLFMFLAAS